jgi:hypothetical protein
VEGFGPLQPTAKNETRFFEFGVRLVLAFSKTLHTLHCFHFGKDRMKRKEER